MTEVRSSERHPAETTPGAVSRHRKRFRGTRRFVTPYVLLAPAILIYLIFTVYPIFRQFDISFYNWHIFPGANNPFLGWSNYTAIFHDPVIRTAAFNSFLFIVITVPIQMAIGLFAAATLTDRLPASMFWRAAVYIPVVTSWVVVSWVFSYSSRRKGVRRTPWWASLLVTPSASIGRLKPGQPTRVIWLLSIWKGVGWSFIIFLAALDGIPRQLLESARIDGASEFRVWRHVVLPSMRGAVTFVTVLLVIGAAQVFTQIFEITKGGPYNSTQSLMTYMYEQAFTNFAFGYAAALASLLALVLFGFSALEIRILRRQDL